MKADSFQKAMSVALKLDHVVEPILYGVVNKEIFYFDSHDAKLVTMNEMDEEEYLHNWQCEGLYRNLVEVEENDHQLLIEPGTLWLKVGHEMLLADRSFDSAFYDDDKFEKIA